MALQFGMIMMFACVYPPAFAFAALNNITEIRADALKLLVMFRRPIPRPAATIGAWLNIFQVLNFFSLCPIMMLMVSHFGILKVVEQIFFIFILVWELVEGIVTCELARSSVYNCKWSVPPTDTAGKRWSLG